nr:hypothetical protein [Bacillus haynesii]
MMKRSIGTFEIDGLTIEYSRVGEGKPILVMHGGHSNCREIKRRMYVEPIGRDQLTLPHIEAEIFE